MTSIEPYCKKGSSPDGSVREVRHETLGFHFQDIHGGGRREVQGLVVLNLSKSGLPIVPAI